MKEKDVSSWEEFEKELGGLREQVRLEAASAPPLLFRGQENSCWDLSTTLERNMKHRMTFGAYYRMISIVKPEIEMATGNTWTIPDFAEVEKLVQDYDPFSLALTFGPRPGYEYMAYLRHHGFSSPLLDWTRSPQVAAYFAFRKALPSARVSIYALSESNMKDITNGAPEVHRMGQFVSTHRRHLLQQSDYTMCLVFDAAEKWRFAEHAPGLNYAGGYHGATPNFTVWKFNIPSSERLKVLRHLDEYNLNAFSLFGSDESLMETLELRRWHFRQDG